MRGQADKVLEWFDACGRDLPWRHSRDRWEILVAELMLQQTQAARVAERWQRFLDRFPTASTCAEAPVADVIAEWSGLGYNRRAVNLHRAATVVTANNGGVVPGDLASLLALPGVGPYTARAIRVFADESDDGVVDTNVARVLARSTGEMMTAKAAQAVADELVPVGEGWRWNQALFDVGARHCRPKPNCAGCPVGPGCAWQQQGGADPAVGSAGVSGRQGPRGAQSRFEGSDRQGRGRLVAALRAGPIARRQVAEAMGWPEDSARAEKVLLELRRDGLVVVADAQIDLPR